MGIHGLRHDVNALDYFEVLEHSENRLGEFVFMQVTCSDHPLYYVETYSTHSTHNLLEILSENS